VQQSNKTVGKNIGTENKFEFQQQQSKKMNSCAKAFAKKHMKSERITQVASNGIFCSSLP